MKRTIAAHFRRAVAVLGLLPSLALANPPPSADSDIAMMRHQAEAQIRSEAAYALRQSLQRPCAEQQAFSGRIAAARAKPVSGPAVVYGVAAPK